MINELAQVGTAVNLLQAVENADPNVRLDNLERISELTGGESLTIREFDQLPSILNSGPIVTTIRTERPIWNLSWLVFFLIGLAGLEWILRRRNDLP